MFITDAIIKIEDFGRKIKNRRANRKIWNCHISFSDTKRNIEQFEELKKLKRQRREQFSQIGISAKQYRKLNQDSYISSIKQSKQNMHSFFKKISGIFKK